MRKLTSIVAALIVVVSSTGTTIAMHYCGKSLQDIAVFEKAKACCVDNEIPSGCCHNEKVEIKSDNFSLAQQISNVGFDSFLIHEISFPVIDFTLHFQKSQSSFLSNHDSMYPPSSPDIVVLVHSFLI